MKTTLTYLEDSYQREATATVVEVIDAGKQTHVILDQTIFYAQGGGQPADQGEIKGPAGTLSVSHVSYNRGAVLHKGKLEGTLQVGDQVTLSIDWPLRYQHMQQHTAGHIIDQAIKNLDPQAISINGEHGIGKRLFIEYSHLDEALTPEAINQETAKIIAQKLPITAEMVTKKEIEKRNITVPFDLPENKDLRIVQIGEYPAMPDGGTQLKTTDESWPAAVTAISKKGDAWRVYYLVEKPSTTKKKATAKSESTSSMSLDELSNHIKDLKKKLAQDLEQGSDDLETKYLGKKGLFNDLAKVIKDLANEDKKAAGQLLNELKGELEEAIAAAGSQTSAQPDWVDLTIPGEKPHVGHLHPISQAMEEITRIFERIGFTRVRYPEVDWDWYAFESLNMPPDHPARDEWETFFVDLPDTTDQSVEYDQEQPRRRHPDAVGGKIVLTPHTSNGQVREMERLGTPPIRMINIARTYRRQQDATHTQMFHQFEGLVVDKGITIQHLKGTLDYFAEQFYGPGTKSRIRPFHFQFTEPSFEVDFSCHICGGTGEKQNPETNQLDKCKFCKSGWHEVGGAGMVHPNVLKAGGIDPEQYTGFAFGWGIERTYTLKEGLNIDDIRLLYSGDLRFLQQF